MFDEVQTGNGRCGSTYVCEQLEIEPDVLLTAKGLGNGLPIGVCMARGEAAQLLGPAIMALPMVVTPYVAPLPSPY